MLDVKQPCVCFALQKLIWLFPKRILLETTYYIRTDMTVKRIVRNAKLIPENRRRKLFPPLGTRRVYSRNVMRLAREATSVPAPPTLTPTRRARASCVKRLSRMAAGTLLMIWQVSAEISIVPWDKRRANSTRTDSIRARLPEKVKNAAKVASSPQSTVFNACRSRNQSTRTMAIRPRTHLWPPANADCTMKFY